MKKMVNIILDIVLGVAILLVIVSAISYIQKKILKKEYNSFFGYTLLEITTGSMSGEIEIGDWVLVKITNKVDLNDIITFKEGNNLVTHRVIEKYDNVYTTKGDSNNSNDVPITEDMIVGKVVSIFPRIGILKKVLLNPTVLLLIIAFVIVLLSIFDKNDDKKKLDIKKIVLLTKNKNRVMKEEKKPIKEEIEKESRNEIVVSTDKDVSDKTKLLSKITVDMNSKHLKSLDEDEF